ncbi:MAG: alpha-ketoacid dehydrogenase subunit alpha/beta [Flavobacteriales bacterium]
MSQSNTYRETNVLDNEKITFEDFKTEVLNDYRIACESREASLLGRREVLTGKAKFGIFGDGKEVAQIALAKVFRKGDWRSGYYRDQTFMMAAGLMTVKQFFAQLYADPSIEKEPMTGGRQMNGHYATRFLDKNGNRIATAQHKNSSADISPTAGQMPRLLGLALASKHFRQNKELKDLKEFSVNGNEVAFGTIGDASTSEGHFWETMNAATVLQVPLCMSVWDDGYGISVPKKYQTAKGSISEALRGFQKDENGPGMLIFNARAWNYSELVETYQKAVATCRLEHIPVLIHVEECTQPQGHSTSGSHERYKSKDRLDWESEYDCLRQMRLWLTEHGLATEEEVAAIEEEAKKYVRTSKQEAWAEFQSAIKAELDEAVQAIRSLAVVSAQTERLNEMATTLEKTADPGRSHVISTVRKALHITRFEKNVQRQALSLWLSEQKEINKERYNAYLYAENKLSALRVKEIRPQYDGDNQTDGRIVLRENWDHILENHPEVCIFGEDVGGIGGVNQTLEGMQKKHGEMRVFDTGIREMTIVGQGLGMAMRGLRPVAEIQYLDYLLYGLQTISDDLATLRYRTKNGQSAPLIISTRGHRLEGIWHSGSPIGMILHSVRGVYVCVPRNMTQAAGMYNTLLQSDDPAIVIEPLNGYRLKENMPSNIGKFTVPLGKAEILKEGTDVTVVSYGSTLRVCEEAAAELEKMGISVELIDAQTLLPFDLEGICAQSVKKTNRLVVVDEDVRGGASAYLLQQIVEDQNAFVYLDAPARTISAQDHRPAYASDGDYFSKPSSEDICEGIYQLMHECKPEIYPSLFE